jgi:hypothetical protein
MLFIVIFLKNFYAHASKAAAGAYSTSFYIKETHVLIGKVFGLITSHSVLTLRAYH